MVNAFNLVLRGAIFQELHVVGGNIMHLIFFVCAFYAFESLLFHSHRNHGGDLTIIPSTMGTHRGDPFGGALFALAHFRALCFIANHFLFLYISIHYK